MKTNIKCEFCGGAMKATGPPINEVVCPKEECTPKHVAQFNQDVRRMIEENKEKRIIAVQKIAGSRAKAIKILKVLREMV
jgi:hypothetical protein